MSPVAETPDRILEQIGALVGQKKFGKAIEAARALLKTSPEEMRALLLIAESYQGLRQFDRARKVLEAVLKKTSRNVPAQRMLGLILMEEGEHAIACRHLRAATDASPIDAEGLSALAFSLRCQGRIDEAKEALRKAMAVAPNEAYHYYSLAQICQENDQLDQAEAALKQGLKAIPRDSRLRETLGRLHLRRGDVDLARQEFELLVKHFPNAEVGYLGLGSCDLDQGDLDRALEHYRQALEKNPRSWKTLAYLGEIHQMMGRIEDAADYYARSLEIEPSNMKIETNLSAALLHIGLVIRPWLSLQAVIGQNPQYQFPRYLMGRLYYQEELYDKAETELRAALELDSKDKYARHLLAEVLLKTGRPREALDLVGGPDQPGGDRYSRLLAARALLDEKRTTDGERVLKDLVKEGSSDDVGRQAQELLKSGRM